MHQNLVLIPTYNERENVERMVRKVFSLKTPFEILIIDDNSPDGTGKIVESLIPEFPGKLHLLKRKGKEGLGKAYLAGFAWGLSKGYEILTEMDADFSHAPHHLDEILNLMNNHSVVIGSRYVKGGGTVNWGLIRKIISKGGSIYSRMIFPLNDWTGGFNSWRAEVLKAIQLDSIKSNGYSFQIELKYKALKNGYHIHETPIIFEDRRVGKSKMSFKIVIEAFYKVWMIRNS